MSTVDDNTEQQAVTSWNLRYPVGTRVRVQGPAQAGGGMLTTTRSVAWVRPAMWRATGVACVAVHDYPGAIPLDRVEPVGPESVVGA